MINVLVLFTCFNRKEKTEQCIRTLAGRNPECDFSFIISDDNSFDGTLELLEQMQQEFDITLLHGNGRLYYSGGMRLAMQCAKEKGLITPYLRILRRH